MGSIILNLSPQATARLERDEEARRRLEAVAEAIFGEPEPYRMTPQQEAMIDEALDGIEAGQFKPFDAEAARERGKRLLMERASQRKEAARMQETD